MIIYAVYKFNNELVYIGMTKDFEKRLSDHKFHTSKKDNIFGRAIRKHGFNAFIFKPILCCFDREGLKEMEMYFIKKFKPRYNMTHGGEGQHQTKEKRERLSNKVKEMWKDPSYRENHLKHTKCPEYKKACSERLKLKFKNNPEYRKKLDKAAYIEKYHIEKIIDSQGTIYESVEDASKKLKCRMNCITRVLSGNRHTFRNLQFEFLNNYNLHGFRKIPKNCGYNAKGVLRV
jgi:group I intron endonuclease